jgi:hypothetical protein
MLQPRLTPFKRIPSRGKNPSRGLRRSINLGPIGIAKILIPVRCTTRMSRKTGEANLGAFDNAARAFASVAPN